MTQPSEAVGGSNDTTVVAAADVPIEDRLASAFGGDPDEQPEPEQAATPDDDGPEEEAELTPDDISDNEDEAEAPEEGEPEPIKPPVSLTAEEQEDFKTWPREAQEAFSRRVGELEKGLHSKAQEAKQVRSQVETEAMAAIKQLQDNYAASIQALLPQVPPRPSHQLQADDPWAYAEQMDAHERAVAQHQWSQQQLQAIQSQRSAAQQAEQQQVHQRELEALREALPEWFDATEGPKLHEQMKSIALDLGYSAEQLHDATASEILALKKVSELKVKADKFDTLMAKKMESVRAAKGMPKVSRPGTPRGKGQVANERYTADRQAMRSGDRDAALRVFQNI